MKPSPVLLGAALAATALAGCKDSNAPVDPLAIRRVLVTVRDDSARLRDDHEFVLALVPIDGRGRVILSDTLDVSVRITSANAPAIQQTVKELAPATGGPIAAAIHMDNSTSMKDNDPDRVRDAAARLFWQTVLTGGENQVSFLSFGGTTATAGFSRTRLLQSWTADQSALEQALATPELADGTDLYRSATEVVHWIDTTRAATDRRIMVLLTDGRPDDDTLQDGLFAVARAANVEINTVGLGTASDKSPRRAEEAVALLRNIAAATGGVYAGADGPAGLETVFKAIATTTSEGVLLATVRLGAEVARGTAMKGTVRVANDKGGAAGEWSFLVK